MLVGPVPTNARWVPSPLLDPLHSQDPSSLAYSRPLVPTTWERRVPGSTTPRLRGIHGGHYTEATGLWDRTLQEKGWEASWGRGPRHWAPKDGQIGTGKQRREGPFSWENNVG